MGGKMVMKDLDVVERGGDLILPIREGRRVFLPNGTFRVLLRSGGKPTVVKATSLAEKDGVRVEAGTYFWSNRDQGLFAQTITPHDARLAFAHTVGGYGLRGALADGGEEQILERIIQECGEDVMLLGAWKSMDFDERQRYRSGIAVVLAQKGMTVPRNEHKIRLKWRLASALSVHDTLGRENLGATRAKLSAAESDANKRLAQVRWIARHVDMRQVPIAKEINDAMRVARIGHAKAASLKRCWQSTSASDVRNEIEKLANSLHGVSDKPWSSIFSHCIEDLRTAFKNAGKPEGEEAIDNVLTSLSLLELYSELADLDLEMATVLDQHPRTERRMALRNAHLASFVKRFEIHIDDLPVRLRGDEYVADREQGDGKLRRPVTPIVARRLARAKSHALQEDWPRAREAFSQVLAAFG